MDIVLPHSGSCAVHRRFQLLDVALAIFASFALNMRSHAVVQRIKIWRQWRAKILGPEDALDSSHLHFSQLLKRWPLKISFFFQIRSFPELHLLERLFEHFSVELFAVFQIEVDF